MNTLSLPSLVLQFFQHSSQAHRTHDDLLDRNFTPTAPNQVWTGNVTYICIKGGWCYLVVVLDLFACRIVGFSFSFSFSTVALHFLVHDNFAIELLAYQV